MVLSGKQGQTGEEKVVKTMCNMHCGGGCLLNVHVRNGVVTRIESDDGEEPQFRPCLKCRAYRQRLYHPDRLKYPMKRVGERGEGKFERISWDEALETIAKELIRVKETYGPEAVFLLSSEGGITHLHKGSLIANLLIRGIGGYAGTWGWHSNGGGKFAALATYGTIFTGNTRDDFLNSRLIIMWGWNPAATIQNTDTSWFLARAKEAGTKIISLDPRYPRSTAIFAHQWIPIRPGTDAAMMVAMAYVMINENLYNRKFLDTYTIGFDQFKDYVLGKEDNVPKTPAWAEKITGVLALTITNLAREYASTKPAALITGNAAGRSAFGEQYHRVAMTLAAMTGNVGIPGGNAAQIAWQGPISSLTDPLLGPNVGERLKGGKNPVDVGPPRKGSLITSDQFWTGWRSSARVNRFLLADAILKGKTGGYPADYKLLYIVNCSYAVQYSNTNKIIQALKKPEFIVVHEHFITPTAKFADILLPNNTFLERNDISAEGATIAYGYNNKVIDSMYETKSLFEFACELAPRLGVTDFSDKTEEGWIKELASENNRIPDYDKFKREGIHKLKLSKPIVAFEEQIKDPVHNPFPTPSGKIEIYSQQIADLGNPMLPPIPKYIETWESPNDPLAEKYPLQLVTSHMNRRAHSQFDNIPWVSETEPQVVWINSDDALTRGIKDGDDVRVFNDRGEIIIPAKVTERIMPGVVDVKTGAWYNPDERGVDRGGCCNILTRDGHSPGEAYPSNTALVQVAKL
ncbi:molybdopterin-dependent oxidoreductase [Chloroflexota bacterium]